MVLKSFRLLANLFDFLQRRTRGGGTTPFQQLFCVGIAEGVADYYVFPFDDYGCHVEGFG